jgi:hypothetical protein
MNVVKPPNVLVPAPADAVAVLYGSIEMGKAEDWQTYITERIADFRGIVYNPRRDDWDASWEQKIENPHFKEQVLWELNVGEIAAKQERGIVVFYFAPGTFSPITLEEFGIHSQLCPKKCVVCCPDGFWRKGNVDIGCEKYGIKQVAGLDDLVQNVLAIGG